MRNEKKTGDAALRAARDRFVTQWGAIGSAWGINRTMAQIHALLLTALDPMSTDEVMEELRVSRGNAHANLRDLVSWGLVRGVVRKGERREYFEAEKDVWKMFCIISRERRRRELQPALGILDECAGQTRGLTGREAAAFNRQIRALRNLLGLADRVLARVADSDESTVIPAVLKVLK